MKYRLNIYIIFDFAMESNINIKFGILVNFTLRKIVNSFWLCEESIGVKGPDNYLWFTLRFSA